MHDPEMPSDTAIEQELRFVSSMYSPVLDRLALVRGSLRGGFGGAAGGENNTRQAKQCATSLSACSSAD